MSSAPTTTRNDDDLIETATIMTDTASDWERPLLQQQHSGANGVNTGGGGGGIRVGGGGLRTMPPITIRAQPIGNGYPGAAVPETLTHRAQAIDNHVGMAGPFSKGPYIPAMPHHSIEVRALPDPGTNSYMSGHNGLEPWAICGVVAVTNQSNMPRSLVQVSVRLQVALADTIVRAVGYTSDHDSLLDGTMAVVTPRQVNFDAVLVLGNQLALAPAARLMLPFRFEMPLTMPPSMNTMLLHPTGTQLRYELTASLIDDINKLKSHALEPVVPLYSPAAVKALISPSPPLTTTVTEDAYSVTVTIPSGKFISPRETVQLQVQVSRTDGKQAKVQTVTAVLVEKYEYHAPVVSIHNKVTRPSHSSNGGGAQDSEMSIVKDTAAGSPDGGGVAIKLVLPPQQPVESKGMTVKSAVNVDGVWGPMTITHVLRCTIKAGILLGQREIVVEVPVVVASCGRAQAMRLVEENPGIVDQLMKC